MEGSILRLSVLSSLTIVLCAVGSEDGELIRLTDHPAPDYSPAFRPDGRFLAFVSEREGGRQIWLVDVTGKSCRRLTKQGNNWSPSFSPDGRTLAFISDRAGAANVWTLDLTTGRETRLTAYHEESPVWSPDGSQIAFLSRRTGEPSLWVMNPDGSQQTLALRLPGREIRRPSWTPDGKGLLFWSNLAGEPSLWTCPLTGRGVVQIPDAVGPIDSPTVSSTGWIAFLSAWTGQWEVWALPLTDGGRPVQVTQIRRNLRDPAWSPDGKRIAFASDMSGNWDLWMISSPMVTTERVKKRS